MLVMISLPPTKSERQQSVNNFWSCIMDTQCTVHRHWPIINASGTSIVQNASEDIATTSQEWVSTEHQWFWSCIVDSLKAMEWGYSIINLSAVFMGKNASNHIASASYNWTPTEHHQILWRFSKLHRNELHRNVTELSHTRSVFSICSCIPLQNYACNVSQIWFFGCSCRVNIWEQAVCFTVSLLLAVF